MKDGSVYAHCQRYSRLVFVWGLFIASAQADYVTLSGRIFGTSYMVKVRDQESIDIKGLESTILGRLDEIDRRMSTYRDDSEVSRFNESAANTWFSVSLETASLVQRALDIASQTSGAFDITVNPAVSLWNFGAQKSVGEWDMPTDEQVAMTRQRVGYDKLAVRLEPPALKKSVDGVEIDLSAIAKGYAVDAIAELLADFEHYMVEIGGEVRTRGSRPLGDGWRIGLESPTRDQRRVDSVLSLKDEALATSGDYRNFYTRNGITYSHTIDPKTGRPVEHELTSVTVLTQDCATADALATAILVMGPDRGLVFATENNVRALLVSRVGDQLIQKATPGFPFADQDKPPTSFLGTFLVTAIVFGIAILAMSVGTIVANRRLQGSCGGMAGLKDSGGKTICDMCTKPSPECSGEPEATSS